MERKGWRALKCRPADGMEVALRVVADDDYPADDDDTILSNNTLGNRNGDGRPQRKCTPALKWNG